MKVLFSILTPLRSYASASLAALLLAPVATIQAQGQVFVPTGIGSRPGNAALSVGFATRSARAQFLYARSATGFRGGEKITKIAMRLDEGRLSPARSDLQVSLRLSTRAVRPARIPFSKFDLNDGLRLGSWSQAKLKLPAVTKVGVSQGFFALPLAQPFVLDPDGSLCVDIKFRTQKLTPSVQRVDSQRAQADPFYSESYGAGCPQSFRSGASGFWVGNPSALSAYTYVRGAKARDIVLAWLGPKRTSRATRFKVGNQPCLVLTAAFILHPIVSIVPQGSDYARFTWIDSAKLANPGLAGIRFMVQHLAFDPQLNISMSNGIDITVGDGKQGVGYRTVFGSSAAGKNFDPDKDTATAFWNGAPVLQIF